MVDVFAVVSHEQHVERARVISPHKPHALVNIEIPCPPRPHPCPKRWPLMVRQIDPKLLIGVDNDSGTVQGAIQPRAVNERCDKPARLQDCPMLLG